MNFSNKAILPNEKCCLKNVVNYSNILDKKLAAEIGIIFKIFKLPNICK